jgi:hypothetical protein
MVRAATRDRIRRATVFAFDPGSEEFFLAVMAFLMDLTATAERVRFVLEDLASLDFSAAFRLHAADSVASTMVKRCPVLLLMPAP